MEKWKGKVALVTGASSGIGAAIAEELVRHGLTVVGLARREERIKDLSEKLKDHKGKLIPFKTDVRKEEEILAAFDFSEKEFGGADILVNNAGVTQFGPFLDNDPKKWRDILDVNVFALCLCSQLFIKSAQRRKVKQGHIINISSVTGHEVVGGICVYGASKHAVTAISKCLRRELADDNNNHIKITQISPGLTRSGMTETVGFSSKSEHILESKDIADVLIDVLSTSNATQICDVIVTPIKSMFGTY